MAVTCCAEFTSVLLHMQVVFGLVLWSDMPLCHAASVVCDTHNGA